MRRSSSACASGHRGNDADLVTSREASVQTLAIADVLPIDKDIDEPANVARIIAESLADSRMGSVECVKHLRDARSGHDDPGFSARESA